MLLKGGTPEPSTDIRVSQRSWVGMRFDKHLKGLALLRFRDLGANAAVGNMFTVI